jgi:hypothetical protein
MLGLAAVGAIMLAGPDHFLIGSVAGSPASIDRPSLCLPGKQVPVMDSPHIPESAASKVRYNSSPPTSGPHFSFTTVPGIYDNPVPDGLTVHALEHGHIVIHYAPHAPADVVSRLRDLTRRFPTDVLLTPNPVVAKGIVLTAWGRIDVLDAFDEERIIAFVEGLRGRYKHGWTRDQDCPS